MQKKTVAALATGTVLALGFGSVGVNEALAKTVTVSIDGTPTEMRTYAGSVGQLLEKDGIELGEHDVVAPALDTRLGEGTEISVQYARPVTVTIDGQAREIWTTATSVDQVLAMLQVTDNQALLSTSRSAGIGREGLEFSVTTSKDVTLVVDGKSTEVVSTARTVADLLKEKGIEANDQYKVEPGLTTELSDGLKVDVTTPKSVKLVVDGKTREVTSTVATVGDLLKQQKVGYDDSYTIKPGLDTALSDGLSISVTKPAPKPTPTPTPTSKPSTTSAAKPTSAPKATSAPEPTSAPKATSAPKPTSAPEETVSSSSGIPVSTWDALAQCESGGNWSINTGNGYYGGLQFNLGTWQAYGGTGLPSAASKSTQIAIATKVQANQGWGAWPACTSKLGLR